MTNNTTQNLSLSVSTYYVLAIKPVLPPVQPAPSIQQCLYFALENGGFWQQVGPRDLADHSRAGYVCIKQLTKRPADLQIGLGVEQDPNATLFAAVAKSLKGSQSLPNTFLASDPQDNDGPMLIIPVSVAPKSRRGVILLFTRNVNGEVVQLVPSSDPEIKSSTNLA